MIFLWVLAHCNIQGNEKADALAKDGILNGVFLPRGVQCNEYDAMIRKTALNDWQNIWNASEFGRWCYSIIPNVKLLPWFSGLNVTRCFIKNMSRTLSNHFTLNSHLYRINLAYSNICSCGLGYQDVDHVIWSCLEYGTARESLVQELLAIGKTPSAAIRDVIASMDVKYLEKINDFIIKTNIKL